MRLAIYTLLRNNSWGGSENLWYKTANLALREGHQVLVIIYNNLSNSRQIAELKVLGAEIIVVNTVLIKLSDKLINKIYANHYVNVLAKPILQKIKLFSPDKFFINQPGNYDIIFHKVSYKIATAIDKTYDIIFHNYNTDINLDEEQIKKMLNIINRANTLYLVAKIQKFHLERHLNKKISNVAYAQNPLTLTSFEKIKYPKTKNIFKMAMVTTIDFDAKGIDKLVRIFSKNNWRARAFELEIFGDGKDKELLNKLIIKNDLVEKIKIMGFSDNIENIWFTNQLLVMSSNVDAAPSVLLEAMICGRACVCTNVGFNNEWIVNYETGFIAQSTDENDLEEVLELAWEERQNWEKLGVNCSNSVKDKIAKNPEVQFLENILDSSLSSN